MDEGEGERMGILISADLLAQWQCDLATDRAMATARRYLSVVRRFLCWHEQHEHQPLDLDQLTPIALVGYRTTLQQTEATSTVNTHVCALRTFCAWLANRGYLAINPALRFKLVDRQPPPGPTVLRDSQINALLRAAACSRHPTRDVAIVQVLLQTGMRIGECTALMQEDITFGENYGMVSIRAGKGNKERGVPLNARPPSACGVCCTDSQQRTDSQSHRHRMA